MFHNDTDEGAVLADLFDLISGGGGGANRAGVMSKLDGTRVANGWRACREQFQRWRDYDGVDAQARFGRIFDGFKGSPWSSTVEHFGQMPFEANTSHGSLQASHRQNAPTGGDETQTGHA